MGSRVRVRNSSIQPNALRSCIALLAAAALLVSARTWADEDLPGRVGRIADLAGAVSIATVERAEQWDPAALNQTIVTGDNLWVATEGRAEVDYGGGQFRLAGDTSVHVARVDDRTIALFIAQGSLIVRVRVLDPGDVAQVDTPNAQIALQRPGLYRIDVTDDRSGTRVMVREGEASVLVPNGAERVLPGQTAEAVGVDASRLEVRQGAFTDGFDGWSASRDRRYERSRSATFVSRQMIGYADLDETGSWEQHVEYGTVWFPAGVAVDWAPYRFGRWMWIGGFGWTWVDDAPWGYAPFHYGRWAYIGGRWGWCPGGWVARPMWAPALVAWYGGPSWGVSVTAGGPVYGWVPLAWGEPYLPSWSNCSHRCWTLYNRPYAVRYAERPLAPPSRYVNQSAPGGFTAVSRDSLITGQRVGRTVVHTPSPANAPVLGTAPVDIRPNPPRIPGARAGTAGAPPPASTFYPTDRANRGVTAPGVGTSAPQAGRTPGTGAVRTPPAFGTGSPAARPATGADTEGARRRSAATPTPSGPPAEGPPIQPAVRAPSTRIDGSGPPAGIPARPAARAPSAPQTPQHQPQAGPAPSAGHAPRLPTPPPGRATSPPPVRGGGPDPGHSAVPRGPAAQPRGADEAPRPAR